MAVALTETPRLAIKVAPISGAGGWGETGAVLFGEERHEYTTFGAAKYIKSS